MKVEIRATPTETFANANGDTIVQKIAPYCDAPQVTTLGQPVVQRFDRQSAQNLVNVFQGNWKKMLSFFGFGDASVPVFNGHPDHGGGADDELTDNRVYAYVSKLEARNDGLWATIKKTPFLDSLKNAMGKLEISPRWNCTSTNGDIFKPTKLLSLGLVRKGNLPQACVINSTLTQPLRKETPMTDEQIQTLATALNVEATFDAILDAVNASKTASEQKDDTTLASDPADAPTGTPEASNDVSAETAEPVSQETAPATEETQPQAEPEAVEAQPETAEPAPMANETAEPDAKDVEIDALKAEIATLKNERQANCEAVVSNALKNGQITPAQKAQAEALLSADFVNAKAFIEALPLSGTFSNGVAATAQAQNAVASEPVDEKTEAAKKFYDLVNSKIDVANGIDVSLAYKIVAGSKDGAELWKAMNA